MADHPAHPGSSARCDTGRLVATSSNGNCYVSLVSRRHNATLA